MAEDRSSPARCGIEHALPRIGAAFPEMQGMRSGLLPKRRPVRASNAANSAWSALRAAIVALAILLAACSQPLRIPADLRTPSVVGVVEEVVQLPDGGKTYRLRNGQTADIPSQKTILLGGEPIVGELLLAGTDADGRQWVAGVELSNSLGRPPSCFDFPARGRANDGWIETESGFRLPRASDFHDPRDEPSGLFASDQGMFCLNSEGEVTSYDVR